MIEIKPGDGADRFDHGLWIHGFTMDGNKQNLAAPGGGQAFVGFNDPTNATDDQAHEGIKVSDQTLIRIQGLVIEDMIVKNFMNEAIRVDRASQAVIRNNLVENVGCWDNTSIGNPGVDGDTLSATYSAWQPGDPGVDQLAAGDMDCGAWGAAQTTTSSGWGNAGYQPGVLSDGIGIEIGCHTDNVVVENNTVRYSTKLGIQTFCDANNEPNGYSPEHIKIVNNDVSWAASAGGILTLGSNFTIVEGNSVTNIKAPWLYGNTGKGISCSALGRYNRFTDNTIVNTAGVGLAPACGCGQYTVDVSPADGNPDGPFVCNVVASNNTIINPCSQDLPLFTCNAISLNTSATVPPANQSEGMTLHNNKVIRPGAFTSSTYFDEGIYSNLSITGDIASGTQIITDGSAITINANDCAAEQLVSAPQVALTDVVEISFNGDPTGINGYGPTSSDGLAIYAYPRDIAGNGFIGFKVCNLTSSNITTPGALTVNWRVTR
jgi:hypothetical protein